MFRLKQKHWPRPSVDCNPPSVVVFKTEILVGSDISPRKLFIFIIYENIFWIKISKKTYYFILRTEALPTIANEYRRTGNYWHLLILNHHNFDFISRNWQIPTAQQSLKIMCTIYRNPTVLSIFCMHHQWIVQSLECPCRNSFFCRRRFNN